MARIYCNDERIVITAKTRVTIFTFELKNAVLNLKLHKILDVDIEVDEIPKLPNKWNVTTTANTIEKSDMKNGFGESSYQNTEDTAESANANNANCSQQIDKQILGSAFSRDGSLLAVVTSMKTCLIYDTRHDWKQRRRAFRIPKAPTAVTFDPDISYVIVADRSGNVCRYKLDEFAGGNTNLHVDINGEESCYEGEPLVGHVSMVLDVTTSDDGRFVLSADRDEKLRISRYPQSFVIHRFCLAHTSYINSVCVIGHIAFTSGGDGTIRVWDIEEGKALAVCDHFAKKPIRCIRKYPLANADPQEKHKLAVLLEQNAAAHIVTFDAQSLLFDVICELNAPANVVDVAFCDEHHLIAITNSSILFGEIMVDGKLKEVEGIDDSLISDLQEAHDGLPCLEKKVGFNNVADYQQRKKERVLNRKRKAHEIE